MATTKKTTNEAKPEAKPEASAEVLRAQLEEQIIAANRERVRQCTEAVNAALEEFGCVIGWQTTSINGQRHEMPIIDVRP